jgi:hypothetical protein
MAITFEASYSKKLGLPNYSSHSFVVSLRTELTDLGQVESASARLYCLLQQSVDKQVREVGFLPDATTYGVVEAAPAGAVTRNGTGQASQDGGKAERPAARFAAPVVPRKNRRKPADKEGWNCSDRQRDLILKLTAQAKLNWNEVEQVAQSRCGQSARSLDRKQASDLIGTLLDRREENGRDENVARP